MSEEGEDDLQEREGRESATPLTNQWTLVAQGEGQPQGGYLPVLCSCGEVTIHTWVETFQCGLRRGRTHTPVGEPSPTAVQLTHGFPALDLSQGPKEEEIDIYTPRRNFRNILFSAFSPWSVASAISCPFCYWRSLEKAKYMIYNF